MSHLHRLLVLSLGLVIVCGAHQLTAAETLFAGVPAYSLMVTEDSFLTGHKSGDNAFTPRNIPCPAQAGPKGCTFRVTVSVSVGTLFGEPYSEAFLQVSTAPFIAVSPRPVANIRVPGLQAPYTMQWLIKNVPAGSAPELQVIAFVGTTVSTAAFVDRTLSIDVFYGLL